MNHQSLIDALVPVAHEAGRAIMSVHARGVVADIKNDGSPVTEADRAAEAIVLEALARIAPEITVISEENVQSHSLDAPDRFFLVDPLDGTKEFLRLDGKGAFTVNIALVENRTPVLGVVFAPALDRIFTGSRFLGAHEGSEKIHVREVPSGGVVAVASASHRDDQTNAWLEERGISNTVSIGSSLKFCMVAAGEADVYPRFGPTMEWDTAAGDAILRAAGGTMSNPDGSLFLYGKPGYRNGAFVAGSKM